MTETIGQRLPEAHDTENPPPSLDETAKFSDGRQGLVHEIRQPLQASIAWVDVCRLHLENGNAVEAAEALEKIATLIEKCDDVALRLITERLSTER